MHCFQVSMSMASVKASLNDMDNDQTPTQPSWQVFTKVAYYNGVLMSVKPIVSIHHKLSREELLDLKLVCIGCACLIGSERKYWNQPSDCCPTHYFRGQHCYI